ncbi:transcription termination factor MTERF6, chloroplastic/mitochondrial [Cajanus cajan]|nr:transcription termination factor MTERF6, chloroplastic/mitochondrial [Cajanus cajan]
MFPSTSSFSHNTTHTHYVTPTLRSSSLCFQIPFNTGHNGNRWGNMEVTSSHNSSSMMWFFKDRGFDDNTAQGMFRRCRRLESVHEERASENWEYLRSIGIQERKLPSIVSKCPKILALDLYDKIVPTVECLKTLETKPHEVASAIAKFPHILSNSVEEKLCPLLAFFQALGIPEKQIGKMILFNPRLISYSIETKLAEFVDFLASLGLSKDGMIGKIIVKDPCIMGYSVDKRLRPTSQFLKSIGLSEMDLQAVAVNFPAILSRDVNKVLVPNYAYLKNRGFQDRQIVALVVGFPPILIKSIQNSLEPRINFLVDVMGRQVDEVIDYPCFFRHGLKRRVEPRYKLLKERNLSCSLSEMLDCNRKKFFIKFGLLEGHVLSN